MSAKEALQSGRCRTCGAEVVWAKTPAGKPIPLDAIPTKRVLIGARTGLAHVVTVYVTHFETCPDAAKHRRGGA